MSVLYTAPQGFKASAPRAGTKQAKNRPLTLEGKSVQRAYPSAEQLTAILAEHDARKRAALIEALPDRLAINGGRVQVSADALAGWKTSILASITPDMLAAVEAPEGVTLTDEQRTATVARGIMSATLASGIVILPTSDGTGKGRTKGADTTPAVVDSLFPA